METKHLSPELKSENIPQQKLSRSLVWGYLRERCQEDGYYFRAEITEGLRKRYPSVLLSASMVARILQEMGFGKAPIKGASVIQMSHRRPLV